MIIIRIHGASIPSELKEVKNRKEIGVVLEKVDGLSPVYLGLPEKGTSKFSVVEEYFPYIELLYDKGYDNTPVSKQRLAEVIATCRLHYYTIVTKMHGYKSREGENL